MNFIQISNHWWKIIYNLLLRINSIDCCLELRSSRTFYSHFFCFGLRPKRELSKNWLARNVNRMSMMCQPKIIRYLESKSLFIYLFIMRENLSTPCQWQWTDGCLLFFFFHNNCVDIQIDTCFQML